MTKYPNIIFFRYEPYADVDKLFAEKKDELNCNLNFTSDPAYLNNMYDPNFHLIVTYGPEEKEYHRDFNMQLPSRMAIQWLHFKEITSIADFNRAVNYCYVNVVNRLGGQTRTVFSVFTTCYKSYDKIFRVYNSLKKQTWKDWEWVILDDSPEEEHFEFLKSGLKDKRIRLYKRAFNSGNIGNVKNEVVSLCRGKYVLEMDHDDELTPTIIEEAVKAFDADPEVGFVYADFSNIYENGKNFNYGNHFALGYSGNYMQKYNDKWIYVVSTPNINSTTLSHIVSVPNHPRIWKKDVLMQMGNYSEFLPICDDYHILVKTACFTKMARIHKLGYIQYMNEGNNNFSLIRNAEINRLTPYHLFPQCYNDYNVNDRMKEKGAYEEMDRRPIWKRGPDYKYVHCNKVINPDYQKTYCILGFDQLKKRKKQLNELYEDPTNDFVVLDNKTDIKKLCNTLDLYGWERMKCYSMSDCSKEELKRYFHLIYRSTDAFEVLEDVPPQAPKWVYHEEKAENTVEVEAATATLTLEEQVKAAKAEKSKAKALKKAERRQQRNTGGNTEENEMSEESEESEDSEDSSHEDSDE
jgi:glycosyltransferase involved in cell wall biosynthesis